MLKEISGRDGAVTLPERSRRTTACERNHKREVVMSRTYRALTTLALSLALVATTAAVASAAQDLNVQRKALYQSELDHNLQAGTAARTQSAIEQARTSEREAGAVAARTETALEQARTSAREAGAVAAPPAIAPQPLPAAPGRDDDVVAATLLGLVGGLILGAAAVVAWTRASRRRHRVVAA
jgi:hypothetical protein